MKYIAAQCDLFSKMDTHNIVSASSSTHHLPHLDRAPHFSVYFDFDSFLRPDIPCLPTCILNETFRLQVRNKFPNPCKGCPDGVKVSPPPTYSSDVRSADRRSDQGGTGAGSPRPWWMDRIPSDTRILIISTGAW